MPSVSANNDGVATADIFDVERSVVSTDRVTGPNKLAQRAARSHQLLLEAEAAYALACKRFKCGQLSALALRNATSALIRWRATVSKLQSQV
jgi:hypothetical protein